MIAPLCVVADENIPGLEAWWQVFADFGISLELHQLAGRAISARDLEHCDVLLVRSVTHVNEALLAGSAVRFVGTATAGLEHVDTDYLQKRGIAFASAPGANANAVAEYVLASLANLSKRDNRDLFAASIGIVGYGHVGKALAHKLEGQAGKLHIYDPPLQTKQCNEEQAFCDWSDIQGCDVISFHVPLTSSGPFPTKGMMDEAFFDAVADDTVLVNAARGEICDEALLMEKLDGSKVSAVWDVWQGEPDINRHLLAKAALATPHIAGYSHDAKIKASDMLLDALLGFLGLGRRNEGRVVKDEAYRHLHVKDMSLVDIVLEAYDPAEDSRALKAVGEREVTKYFDSLRKHYRKRHEWNHIRVHGLAPGDERGPLLDALGFSLVSESSKGGGDGS